jgi:hypothetical protein
MTRATPAAAAFKEVIDSKLLLPAQRNLFTGEPEPIQVDVDDRFLRMKRRSMTAFPSSKQKILPNLSCPGSVYSWGRRVNGSLSERGRGRLPVSFLQDPGSGNCFEGDFGVIGSLGRIVCPRHTPQFLGHDWKTLRTNHFAALKCDDSNASRPTGSF